MFNFLFYFVLGVSLLIVGMIYEDKLVEIEDYILFEESRVTDEKAEIED